MGNVCHPSAFVCAYLDWLPRLSLSALSVLLDTLEFGGLNMVGNVCQCMMTDDDNPSNVSYMS